MTNDTNPLLGFALASVTTIFVHAAAIGIFAFQVAAYSA